MLGFNIEILPLRILYSGAMRLRICWNRWAFIGILDWNDRYSPLPFEYVPRASRLHSCLLLQPFPLFFFLLWGPEFYRFSSVLIETIIKNERRRSKHHYSLNTWLVAIAPKLSLLIQHLSAHEVPLVTHEILPTLVRDRPNPHRSTVGITITHSNPHLIQDPSAHPEAAQPP